MLKNVRKSRVLLILVVGMLTMVLFGNIHTLATDTPSNNSTPLTITATTADNTEASANNVTGNTNTNTNTNTNRASVNTSNNSGVVSASGNNTNATNNTNNNTSTYNNTNTTKNKNLPYAGSSYKTILLVAVFAISAVYAYKKVSDYNM